MSDSAFLSSISLDVLERARRIKLFLMDVDGTLTDGGTVTVSSGGLLTDGGTVTWRDGQVGGPS